MPELHARLAKWRRMALNALRGSSWTALAASNISVSRLLAANVCH